MPAWFVVGRLLACVEPTPAEREPLQWEAPAQCPTSQDVLARARALGAPDLAASATIEAVPGGFAAHVEHDGRRHELRSASCDELATAVAVLLAGADGSASPSSSTADAQPDTTSAPGAIVPPPVVQGRALADSPAALDRARPPSTPAGERWPSHADPPAILGPQLRAAALVGGGLVPRIDIGGQAALGWSWRRVVLELGAFAVAPRRQAIDATTNGTVMVAAGSVQASARLRWSWFELRPGAAFEAGASRVRARGEVVRRIGRAPWLAVRAELRALAWLHPRVAITVAAAMVVPLLQTRYRIGDTLLFAGRRVGVAGSIGLAIALGRRA